MKEFNLQLTTNMQDLLKKTIGHKLNSIVKDGSFKDNKTFCNVGLYFDTFSIELINDLVGCEFFTSDLIGIEDYACFTVELLNKEFKVLDLNPVYKTISINERVSKIRIVTDTYLYTPSKELDKEKEKLTSDVAIIFDLEEHSLCFIRWEFYSEIITIDKIKKDDIPKLFNIKEVFNEPYDENDNYDIECKRKIRELK